MTREEAIKEIKTWDFLYDDEKEVIETLIPELKESEDDKVRKEIISALKNANYKGVYDKHLAWLEKQGEKPQGKTALKAINEEKIDNANKVVVEPKFKTGDWIINRTDATIMQIVNNKDFYESVEIGGQRRTDTYNYVEWDFRLWSIEDAKDGDVLVASDDSILLFKCVVDAACKHYIALTTDNVVKFNEGLEHFWETSRAVHPATKEQRDLLFSKMKEAGYEWDAEKKELKKIEQSIDIPFGAKDSELQEVSYYIPEGFHAEIYGNKVVIKKGEQKPAWREEDESGSKFFTQ